MYEVLLILALVLAALFAFKLVKKAVSLVFTVTTVIGVVLLVLGFFVLQDANAFKEGFSSGKNVFVLDDNGTYLTSMVLDFNSSEPGIESYPALDSLPDDIEEGELPDEYYKVFMISREAFLESDVDEVRFADEHLAVNDTVGVLYSEEPHASLAAVLAQDKDLPQESVQMDLESTFPSEADLRRALFGSALIEMFGSNPMNLIQGIKKGNILIHPDSLMFQAVDFIPLSVFEQAGDVIGDEEAER